MPPPIEASADVTSAPDAPSFSRPDGGMCTTDTQCTASNACLTGRCDQVRHVCVYDVCKQVACKSSECDVMSRTCSAPVAYGFHAASFKVSAGPIGCGGSAARCIAANYPFVFVGTTNGVVAYSVADIDSSSPNQIPVTGLPFLPTAMVSSGARVYFLASPIGTGPSYKLQVAWVDVPVDPLAGSMAAQTVLLGYPAATVQAMFASQLGGVLVAAADPSKFYPSAQLLAPLMDLAQLQIFPNAGIPAGSVPVTASGDRVVSYRWDGNNAAYAPYFSLETGAGTASAQNAGEQGLVTTMGPVHSASVFSQGNDGSVLWAAPSVSVGADGAPPTIRSVRLAWILGGASGMQFDARTFVDVEPYSPEEPLGNGPALLGPVAWVDAQTALVLAASPSNTSQTSVQVATRSGAMAQLAAGKRYVLPNTTDKLGAASTNGIAYVLADDASDSATVHVFAPGCM
jgi:hypothetical protein